MNASKLFLIITCSACLILASCCAPQPDSFKVVFFTDVHLTDTDVARKGFHAAVEKINATQPDFCISGGDNTGFAKGTSLKQVDKVNRMYTTMVRGIDARVNAARGNHELLHHYNDSACIKNYMKGPAYYSFDYEGWHFMILNGVKEKNGVYVGEIDARQMNWIKKDLAAVASEMPIVVVSHIPFQTVFRQRYFNATKKVSEALIINNNQDVLGLFEAHNLKLVLQGHTHIFEDINVGGVRYITGGAVSGAWWKGPRFHTKQGFLSLTFLADDFDVEYVTINDSRATGIISPLPEPFYSST